MSLLTWKPSNNFLAQAGHLALGALAPALPYFLFKSDTYAILGTIIFLTYVWAKETIVDPWLEGDPFWWDGFEDSCYLLGGCTITWAVRFLLT